MLRPKRENQNNSFFRKFVMYFSMLMTLLYAAIGIFLIFADTEDYNLAIPKNVKIILGGVLILYGVVRFVRVYQRNNKIKRNRNEE